MKHILFDFDGVFVDSFQISYQASKKATNEEFSEDHYRTFFHGNIFEHASVSEQMKVKKNPSAEDTFFVHYIPALLELPPISGMKELARELAADHVLTLVSSTINTSLRQYLHLHDMAQFFDTILGGDVHTSKVFKIKMVLELHQITPPDCLFVTDTLGDIREAAKAGVQSIGVTWGFHQRLDLEKGSPQAIVETPAELKPAIDQYFD